MAKTATLLWIDLEMTGLVPGEDKIMEVAAVATGWDLEPTAEFTATVKVDPSIIKERMVGNFWKENPESYKALVSKNDEGKSAEEVEKDLLSWISKNFAASAIPGDAKYKDKIILAGNSIHQDRKFIDIEMPELSRRLHYRMLDVSAWKLYFEGAKHLKYTKREDHRALADIKGSIGELKWYLTFLK